jgi:DNA-binding transcriptional ArsR family regulator
MDEHNAKARQQWELNMTQQDAFAAIADPNRRVLLEELRRGPKTVNELSALLPHISRPAVSQHLKMLLDAEIAKVENKGTSRIYSLTGEGLVPVSLWLDQFWNV